MKIYAKIFDNIITELSLIEKEGFDLFECNDNDIFNNFRLFTVKGNELVLGDEYKKLAEDEYLIRQLPDGQLTLSKPYIEHIDNIFMTLTDSEEHQDIKNHLGDYYKLENGFVVVDNDLKENYIRNYNVKKFREYRAECFKRWDIQKTNFLIGLGDPITEADKAWYTEMLNFTDMITNDTTASDWPVTPDKFKPVY